MGEQEDASLKSKQRSGVGWGGGGELEGVGRVSGFCFCFLGLFFLE